MLFLLLKVRETLKSYDKSLERIAHLMPPDVHRLLEKESLTINSTVLANKKAYANLVAHLLTGNDLSRTCLVLF